MCKLRVFKAGNVFDPDPRLHKINKKNPAVGRGFLMSK